MALIFEQQPNESNKAFAAFSLYLSLGPDRSTQAVATKLAKSEQLVRRWSARHHWTDRVAAHAAHLATVEREATEVLARGKSAEWLIRQEEQRDEEWRSRGELLEMAREAIKRWKNKPERCGSLEGIARLLELASKLGRLATGMATDKMEVTGEDGGPIQVELEAALKKVYGVEVSPAIIGPAPCIVDVEAELVQPVGLPEGT